MQWFQLKGGRFKLDLRKKVLRIGQWGTGTGCSDKLGMSHPWKWSRSGWLGAWSYFRIFTQFSNSFGFSICLQRVHNSQNISVTWNVLLYHSLTCYLNHWLNYCYRTQNHNFLQDNLLDTCLHCFWQMTIFF